VTTQTPDSRSRWTALIVLCAGVAMIVLDSTVVNLALPSILLAPWPAGYLGRHARRRQLRCAADGG
jgi:hypothetical protein